MDLIVLLFAMAIVAGLAFLAFAWFATRSARAALDAVTPIADFLAKLSPDDKRSEPRQ